MNEHPRDPATQKKFSYCEPLGTYNKRNITKLAKEINIGPSMFLMTVKQLMWLFCFVSVLNIPLYIFFYQINGVGTPRTLIEYFSRFSLTNTER